MPVPRMSPTTNSSSSPGPITRRRLGCSAAPGAAPGLAVVSATDTSGRLGRCSAVRPRRSFGLLAHEPKHWPAHGLDEGSGDSEVATEGATRSVVGAAQPYLGDEDRGPVPVREDSETPGADGILGQLELPEVGRSPVHSPEVALPPAADEAEHELASRLVGEEVEAVVE